jgi:HlyD family secretion protein
MKRNKLLIYGLVAVVLILLVVAIVRNKNKPTGELVETEKVEYRTIKETVAASGKVFPEKEVKISSDVSGEIVELHVEEGDSVKAGMLLAKIDPEAYISAVERGRASLNNSKAQLAVSRSQVENNTAQLEQIRAQLANTRKIHKRNEELLAEGVISQAEFDNSLSNLEAQEANLRAAQANLRSSEESVKASEFTVASADASLKELRTSLQRTSIYAPTNGIVSKLNVEEGERVVGTIQMAGTEMMRIANLNNMEVQVEVSENDIIRVSLHDEVEIEVDAYLDRFFGGQVTEIANTANNAVSASGQTVLTSDQVTNFVVKIRIDPESYADLLDENAKYPFRPGMSASVEINTDTRDNVLSIPIQAVASRSRDEGKDEKEKTAESEETEEEEKEDLMEVVFVVSADTVAMIEVETGIQDDEYIHVISGLEEGMEIVSGPYRAVSRNLKNGSKVQIKEEEEDPDVNRAES